MGASSVKETMRKWVIFTGPGRMDIYVILETKIHYRLPTNITLLFVMNHELEVIIINPDPIE